MKKIFLKGKDVFLTISQCEPNKSEFIKEILVQNEKSLLGGLIAQEYHYDKGTHYHIFLRYEKYKYIYSEKCFNYILGKHVHIEKCRFSEAVKKYCKKDKNYISFGNIEDSIRKTSKLSHKEIESILFKRIEEGENIFSLSQSKISEVRQYVQKYNTMLSKAFAFHRNCERHKYERLKKGLNIPKINTYKDILQKLKEAEYYRFNRPFKTSNLHIYSHFPGVGKTSLLNFLRENAASYTYPPTQWFKDYLDETYTYVLWDEFSLVGWDIQFLNLFLEGSPVDLPVKFSVTTKTDNPLVIMCSNRSLREHFLYKFGGVCKCNLEENHGELCMKRSRECKTNDDTLIQYRTLKARVTEVKIRKENRLFELIDELKKFS